MKPNSYLAVFMIGLLLALAACNLPRPQPQVISQQDVINTSAARTVAALSTALADGKNPTLAAPTTTPLTPSPTTASTDPGPEPSITPGPSETSQQSAGGATIDPNTTCNKAAFVKDITIPDGSILPANSPFEKTWELKNTGTCSWNNTYNVVFSGSGNSLSGPAATPLLASGEVKPGESVKVTVNLRAPGEKGTYDSRWLLRAPDGKTFGLGEKGTGTFYTQIKVDDSYSFAALYCSAAWSSGAGALVCPGKETDAQGSVVQLENTQRENGSSSEGLALSTTAQPVSGGYIVGRYPAIMVPQGADFRALIGCRSGVAGCYVRFKLTAQVDNGPEQTLGEWNEGADGNMTQAIVDLDAYGGKPTAFNLYLYVNGTLDAAKGLWIDPRIVK